MKEQSKCLGCNLANKNVPVHVIYEDNYVTCMLDHDPFNRGHMMILPKEHFEDVDDLTDDVASAVMQAAKLLSKAVKKLYEPDGITICQNGGIFSELTHFHMHVVPRYQSQSFATFYLDETFDNESEKNRLLTTRNDIIQTINKILLYTTNKWG